MPLSKDARRSEQGVVPRGRCRNGAIGWAESASAPMETAPAGAVSASIRAPYLPAGAVLAVAPAANALAMFALTRRARLPPLASPRL